MLSPTTVPPELRHRPFTLRQAREAGLSASCLKSRQFKKVFRGVYAVVELEMTFFMWVFAALLVLPHDAVTSHLTALRMYGLDLQRDRTLHFSTNTETHSRQNEIVTHRRGGQLACDERDGLPITGPDRTLVDIATKVSFVNLIQAADWMLHKKLTTLDDLATYAMARHLDGVVRMRGALEYIREGAESPMETLIRLMVVFAQLPEPKCNRNIFTSGGHWLARGDLVYFDWHVLVEYDGIHHERDPWQRQKDRERREALEAEGWRVIVITAEDLREKRKIVWRIYNALKARGYDGRPPHVSAMWANCFP